MSLPFGVLVNGLYVGGKTDISTKTGKPYGSINISIGSDCLRIMLSPNGITGFNALCGTLNLGDPITVVCQPYAGDRGGLMYTHGEIIGEIPT